MKPFLYEMVNLRTCVALLTGDSRCVVEWEAGDLDWRMTDDCKDRLDAAVAEGRRELGMEP